MFAQMEAHQMCSASRQSPCTMKLIVPKCTSTETFCISAGLVVQVFSAATYLLACSARKPCSLGTEHYFQKKCSCRWKRQPGMQTRQTGGRRPSPSRKAAPTQPRSSAAIAAFATHTMLHMSRMHAPSLETVRATASCCMCSSLTWLQICWNTGVEFTHTFQTRQVTNL